MYFDVLTFTSKLHALSDIFYSPLLTLTHIRAGRNVISCPHMIQMEFVLWNYPLVQSVNVINDQAPSTQLLPCILLSSYSALITQVYTGRWHRHQEEQILNGIRKCVGFCTCVSTLPIQWAVWEEWKKPSLVACTKWSQSGTGKVHGQIPFCLNSREANEEAKLQSFDLKMSLASIKICLKFLLFSSTLLPFAFLCCMMNVSWPDFAIVALCFKATLT